MYSLFAAAVISNLDRHTAQVENTPYAGIFGKMKMKSSYLYIVLVKIRLGLKRFVLCNKDFN